MRYTIALIACLFFFAQCSRETKKAEPTGNYDTLGVHWMTIERENIKYYFQGTGIQGAVRYADLHDEAYVTLNKEFIAQLPQKLQFFVWTDWAQGEQTLNHPLGFAVAEPCVCHVRASQTLGHEITHILSYWSRGIKRNSYNKFINEGLAVAFDLNGDDKIETAKSAIAGKGLRSVVDVWSGLYKASDEVLYPLGGAFMDFLYKQNQPEQFHALIKNQTIQDADSIYGKDRLQKLIADFDTKVGLPE